MRDQTYLDDLRLAHVMADNADSITTSRFKALDLKVDAKPDLTPVSDADVAAARAKLSGGIDALDALIAKHKAQGEG